MKLRRLMSIVFAVMFAVSGSADEAQTTTRVFQIRYTTVAEASSIVQPLLSELGTLTVHPSRNRITVQDTSEIVGRVAEVLAELDTIPGTYVVRVRLLRATDAEVAPKQRVEVDGKVRQMFPSASFVEIGSTVIEGELKTPVSASIGAVYRVSFVAEPQRVPNDAPFGMPTMGTRYTLRDCTLTQTREKENGEQITVEVIHSDVSISPGQQTHIGAGASGDSKNGVVLIIEAIPVTKANPDEAE
jgi:hypothetical protein